MSYKIISAVIFKNEKEEILVKEGDKVKIIKQGEIIEGVVSTIDTVECGDIGIKIGGCYKYIYLDSIDEIFVVNM